MNQTCGRWRLAQEHERTWWEREMQTMEFSYFERFAGECQDALRGIATVGEETRILEIGSGPAGILTYLPSRFRCGIDPLEGYYGRIEKCCRFRDAKVHYLAAKGEAIPFSENSFDLVIIDNILDHCEDIEKVFGEIQRVLRPSGILYLRNFTHTLWGAFLGRMLEYFKIDRGHPFHFREKDLRESLKTHRLDPISVKRRGFVRHFWSLLASGKKTNILRALSFSQKDKVLFIARNRK